MLFDTHTHIQFDVFDKNRDEVIADAKKAGVEKIIAVGTNLGTSEKAIEVAKKYEQVYASIGIHPHHVFEHFHSDIDIRTHLQALEKYLKHPKVIAVGETGTDKHDYPKTKYKNYAVHEDFLELQKELFELQIKLAIKYKKTLILHTIQAIEELLEVLNKNWDKFLEGRSVFHCCESDQKLLDFAIKHNICIGIDADVSEYKEKEEFVKKVPLELLVLETDSPFLSPPEKTFPNTPANLALIAQKIAEIKKIDFKKVEEITFENSNRLFNF